MEATPTKTMVILVTFITSVLLAFGFRKILKMSLAKMEPAPKRSESELDMVAEITPEKSRPQMMAGMVRIAKIGKAYRAPTEANSSAENFPILISASTISPKTVGIKA